MSRLSMWGLACTLVRAGEFLCSDQGFVWEEPQNLQPWIIARDALDRALNLVLHFGQGIFAGVDVGKPSYHDPV